MKTRWYKDAVFYQIYPRSFCDSNGDGIGDLRGIISKLDYLKNLGIDAIWLSPCYDSPNDDNGYDIRDYHNIMAEFGTFEDWQAMLEEIHKRDMKLVMDLVVNHTSDEHFWFKEAKKSVDNPYRDYYIWRKGRGKNGKKPPNKWISNFVGSAWEYEQNTDEYYLHLFSKKQPDLNWDNPKVRKEVIDICNFWLELGVDGFRCDVITYIAKPEGLKGSYVVAPNWQKYIKEVAQNSWDNYDTMIVGECAMLTAERAPEIQSEKLGLLDTSISFDHTNADAYFIIIPHKFRLKKFKQAISRWQNLPQDCWNSLYLENHDQPRSIPRYVKEEFRNEGAKMLSTMLMFLRGTPYIYQGQELGMSNTPFKEEDYKDIMSLGILRAVKKYLPFLKGFALKKLGQRARDNSRTPTQWSAEKYAGFSTVEPWMKLNPNYVEVNAESAVKDANSIYNYDKKLIKLRKNYTDILKFGDYKELLSDSKKLFCYNRSYLEKNIFVVCSFSSKSVDFTIPAGMRFEKSELIISNNNEASNVLINCKLKPYECRAYLLMN